MKLSELVETGGDESEGNTKSDSSSQTKVITETKNDTTTWSKTELKNKSGRSSKRPREVQRKYWAFTLFYEKDDTLETVETAFQGLTDKYIIGRETCPKTGRKHLQGFVAFTGKGKRFSQISTLFQWHIEPCKGNEDQNAKYCRKEGSYVSYGMKIPVAVLLPDQFRPYQKTVYNIITNAPDKRKIHWFYDEKKLSDNKRGNVGKSEFTKYLFVKHKAVPLTDGKKSDLINIIFNQKDNIECGRTNLIVIDIPRSEYNKVSYGALEAIKSGLIVNTKYETGGFAFNPVHVIVFSNFFPDTESTVSKDRWDIYYINKQYEAIHKDVPEIEVKNDDLDN